MVLETDVLAEIEKTILPLISAASQDALRMHEAATRADGENYSDNWNLGCNCWRILFNSLNKMLEAHPFFEKQVQNNVMKITCKNGDQSFSFYVYRVDEGTRIPKGAKSLKSYLQEQLWLSDEIKSLVLDKSDGINILGYDISLVSGMGHVTLDSLIPSGKNKFDIIRLHDFGKPQADVTPRSPDVEASIPEVISKPAVIRDQEEKKVVGEGN